MSTKDIHENHEPGPPLGLGSSAGLGLLPERTLAEIHNPATGEREVRKLYTADDMRAYAMQEVAAESERREKHLRDLAARHQRAADMTDNSTVEQRHDAMAAALLAAIEGPNVRTKAATTAAQEYEDGAK